MPAALTAVLHSYSCGGSYSRCIAQCMFKYKPIYHTPPVTQGITDLGEWLRSLLLGRLALCRSPPFVQLRTALRQPNTGESRASTWRLIQPPRRCSKERFPDRELCRELFTPILPPSVPAMQYSKWRLGRSAISVWRWLSWRNVRVRVRMGISHSHFVRFSGLVSSALTCDKLYHWRV